MLKPISIEALQGLAENATHLARIIRQWLPVTGDAEAKTASRRTAERWFYQAAEHFTVCERIRNPHKLAFNQRGGFYYGPSGCSAAWSELESAIDGIAVAYRLQPVADETGTPHLPYEHDVPAIDAGTLKRLELAASEILEAVRDEHADESKATAKQQSPFARAADTVPDAYKEHGRECGPLEGTKTALAYAVTGNPKAKPEDLETHHLGKVFVREIKRRKFEVFFRSFRELNTAKQRLTPDNSE
jgi:hypothetical protein